MKPYTSSKSELQTITEKNTFFAVCQSIPREGQGIPIFGFQKGKLLRGTIKGDNIIGLNPNSLYLGLT